MSEAVDHAGRLLGDLAQRRASLAEASTYRAGGPAALFMEVDDDPTLATVASVVTATGVEVLVVGRGSNLLVADDGFDGLALRLGDHFAHIDIQGTTVTVGGATSLPVVARRTAAAGLTGFEWAVGVPGSVGGAVRMNAGGHGSDIAQSLVRVRVLDLTTGEDTWVPNRDLQLSYRHSAVRSAQVVVAAELALAEGDRDRSEEAIAEIVRWRRENQPGGANAGSVFTNPPDDSAGRLIEAAGGKGLRRGTAEVSTKHANFIQVDDGGRADDVFALMLELQRRVETATGVRLHAETRLVGFPPKLVDELQPRAEVEGS